MIKGVLLDTSFFIRLLNKKETLHKNAIGYFRFFLDNETPLFMSTISIAEYCVKGDKSELPLKYLKILPFNMDHAEIAGKYALILFQNKKVKNQLSPRPIIVNDAKIFAQAHLVPEISHYVTADQRSRKILSAIKKVTAAQFDFIDIHNSYKEQLGELPFE